MSQEPKKRHSRARQGKRRASISLGIPAFVTCPNCGAKHAAHTVCNTCGFYAGKEVLSIRSTHENR
jgi:large subunit ribosomal protein L32